jgi:large subunit ribosomal protein L4e
VFKKINKKELLVAFNSAFGGTAKDMIVFDKGVLDVKTKDFILVLKKVFGDGFDKVLKVKKVRAGRGKMRGRKYKSNAGLLFVIGSDESMARKGVDVVGVRDLRIKDLAPNGEVGRLVCYTKSAVEELGNRFQNASLKNVGGKK